MTIALRSKAIIQTCYHVADIEEACARWNAIYGIGPFWIMDRPPLPQVVGPHGDIALEFTAAIAMTGDYTIELIQSHNDAELFASIPHQGSHRMHHIGFFSDDYDADKATFEQEGSPVVCEVTYPTGKRIGYIDARATEGHYIEILEENPDIRAIVDLVRSSAAGWDGKNLMRYIPMGNPPA